MSKQFFELWRPLKGYYWYQRLLSISILGLCGAFALQSLSIAVVPNAQLQDWRFFPEIAQLEFTLSATSKPKVFFLSQPSRLVVDLPGTKLGSVATQQNYFGAVQRIRLSQLNASDTRIVMDLAPGTNINPNQVILQPTSPTSWALRAFTNSYTNQAPGTYPPQPPNNIPQGIYPPQPANNIPQGIYPPQPANNIPQGIYPPLPPNNIPQGVYLPQPPNNIPQGVYLPQPANNIPQGTIYQSQPPGIVTQPGNMNLPSTNNNTQQAPFVSVPPLAPNNSSQIPGSMLPPATFPNPSGGIFNTPPLISPNYTVPTYPNNPNNPTINNPSVVPWGQSLPSQR